MKFSDIKKISFFDYPGGPFQLSISINPDYQIGQGEFNELHTLSDLPQEKINLLAEINFQIEESDWDYRTIDLTNSPYSMYQTLRYHFGERSDPDWNWHDDFDGFAYALMTQDSFFLITYDAVETPSFRLEAGGPKGVLAEEFRQIRELLGKETTKLRKAGIILEPDYSVEFQNPFHVYFKQAQEILERNQKFSQLWQAFFQSDPKPAPPQCTSKRIFVARFFPFSGFI